MMVAARTIPSEDPNIVTRQEWGAKTPKLKEMMQNPVPFVVIHHSYHPSSCTNKKDCIKAMQWMQDFHQVDRGWNDIGYGFAVGSDGGIYEGRGWSSVGAHAPGYNARSIGICVIGDWRYDLPPEIQLAAVKELILMGVKHGKIAEDYRLVGHRQVRDTECPGEALFSEIQKWPHFTNDSSIQRVEILELPLKETAPIDFLANNTREIDSNNLNPQKSDIGICAKSNLGHDKTHIGTQSDDQQFDTGNPKLPSIHVVSTNNSSEQNKHNVHTLLNNQKPDIREGIDILLPDNDNNNITKRGSVRH